MYNQLPSTVLRDATTFDLMVVDVYSAWEKYKADPGDNTQYDTEQLENILRQSRGE